MKPWKTLGSAHAPGEMRDLIRNGLGATAFDREAAVPRWDGPLDDDARLVALLFAFLSESRAPFAQSFHDLVCGEASDGRVANTS